MKISRRKPNLIDSTCPLDKSVTMDRHFGVIRSPSGVPTTPTKVTSCRWHITPAGFSRIKVIVQLVSSRSTPDGCDARVLSLASVDCSNGTVVTSWFCEPTSSGTEVVSCGDVWLRSPSPQRQDSANTFIVTYQRYNTHDTTTIPDDLANCVAPQGISTSRTTTHPSKYTLVSTSVPQQPSPKLMSVGRNYGPGDGIFEYRDTLYDEDVAGASNREDTNILSKQLRLLVLYIFFGVVILVLVIALAAVIVSYHRISKCKDQGADSSEKTALWQHNEDTPMETFLNRSLGTWSGSRETTCTHTADSQTEQIVATVHHEATSGRTPTDPQYSRGSAITTFVRRNSDLKDTTNNFLQCSLTLSADQDHRYKSDKENENSRRENSDDVATSGTDHHTVPSKLHSTFYEVMDFNVSKSVCADTGSMKLHFPQVDILPDESQEDKLYEVANDDSSVVGHLQCPSHDLHYGVNNDDYAAVCRPGRATKTSHAASPGDDFRKRNANCADPVLDAGQCLTTGSSNKQAGPSTKAGWPDQSKRCT